MSQINNDFNWSNILPWNWDIFKSNNITSDELTNLNGLISQQSNLMGPINEVRRNDSYYQPFTLDSGRQLYRDRSGVFRDVQGNPIGIKMGLDGKAYSDGSNSLSANFAQYGNLALSGLQALGGLYMGNKMYGLAKDQFAFQKDFANRNLANSMKTYNNALADRINSRYAFEGRSQAEADDYLKKHSL